MSSSILEIGILTTDRESYISWLPKPIVRIITDHTCHLKLTKLYDRNKEIASVFSSRYLDDIFRQILQYNDEMREFVEYMDRYFGHAWNGCVSTSLGVSNPIAHTIVGAPVPNYDRTAFENKCKQYLNNINHFWKSFEKNDRYRLLIGD